MRKKTLAKNSIPLHADTKRALTEDQHKTHLLTIKIEKMKKYMMHWPVCSKPPMRLLEEMELVETGIHVCTCGLDELMEEND